MAEVDNAAAPIRKVVDELLSYRQLGLVRSLSQALTLLSTHLEHPLSMSIMNSLTAVISFAPQDR